MNRGFDVPWPWHIFDILAHRAAIAWAIHKAIRMFAPECLGDMAAPADRQMGLKGIR
jgi:hypothetical protein